VDLSFFSLFSLLSSTFCVLLFVFIVGFSMHVYLAVCVMLALFSVP
jgi:hypothetical protein